MRNISATIVADVRRFSHQINADEVFDTHTHLSSRILRMMLANESIAKFQIAYKESYDEDISVEEAREMASRIKLLYELLARPLPGEEGNHARPSIFSSRRRIFRSTC
jgi:hypothetical protein